MPFLSSSFPSIKDFFQLTPQANAVTSTIFKWLPVVNLINWTHGGVAQPMGRTGLAGSKWNFPGRLGWMISTVLDPIMISYYLYTLPKRFSPPLNDPMSLFGTGLPVQNEILGFLYFAHYFQRSVIRNITATSIAPVHASMVAVNVSFHFMNASNIAYWLIHTPTARGNSSPLVSPLSVIGFAVFMIGCAGNWLSEQKLFDLRREAAEKKAKEEGKPTAVYDKVYVIPPKEGWFRYVMYPYYSLEWLEWLGYYILGYAWGLPSTWKLCAPSWFLVSEVLGMSPRAVEGLAWYRKKFGDEAVGDRKSSIPGLY